MKTIILASILFVATFITVSAQQDSLLNTPDERITVEKEYDENGNLIRFDSTYVFEWKGDTLMGFPNHKGLFPQDGFMEMDDIIKEFFNDSSRLMPFGNNWGIDPFQSRQEFIEQFKNQFSDSTLNQMFSFRVDSSSNPFHFKEFKHHDFSDFFEDFEFPDEFHNDFNWGLPHEFKNKDQQNDWEELKKRHKKEIEKFHEKWKSDKKEDPQSNMEFQKL